MQIPVLLDRSRPEPLTSQLVEQLRDAIRRNALPLFATHSTFALIQEDDEIETMLAEHHAIYDCLLAHDKRAAMAALKAHIRRSLEPNIERLRRIGSLPESLRPPFLIQVGGREMNRRIVS